MFPLLSRLWVVRVWATYPHRRYGFGFMFCTTPPATQRLGTLARVLAPTPACPLSHEGSWELQILSGQVRQGLDSRPCIRHVAYDTNIHSRTTGAAHPATEMSTARPLFIPHTITFSISSSSSSSLFPPCLPTVIFLHVSLSTPIASSMSSC